MAHFYTISDSERDAADAAGFHVEGTAGYAYPTQNAGTVPLWRLTHSEPAGHFYTTSDSERDNAARNLGYVAEGVSCYVYPGPEGTAVPFHRLYLPTDGEHFWTANDQERDVCVANGWTFEGEACWLFVSEEAQTVPLYRLLWDGIVDGAPLHADTGDHVVGGGEYMHTVIDFQSNGKVYTDTHTWCKKKFAGFTGGLIVSFEDDKGNILANTPGKDYGVDGTWTGLPSSRQVREEMQVDPSLYERTRIIRVWLNVDPHNRLKEDVAEMAWVAKTVADAVGDVKRAIGSAQSVPIAVNQPKANMVTLRGLLA